RYAVTQKDNIRKYYLLDKDSADYARMKKEGYRPLVRGSLKHRLIFLNSDMIVASNSTVCAFNDYDARTSHPFRGMLHFGVACVQHGMSVQNIAVAQNRLRDNTKLYFCASPYEITNLSKPVYDYVGYDALKLTGVPRYDGLKDRAEKIILLSPTWRMQSAMPVTKNEGVARDYNPNFKETSYYKVYNGLINDPKLLEAAKKYGYRIQYVLHPIVSPQAEDFEKNDFVEIIPAIGDMSYEKLFCEAALMVTDFSGVQFDFAYMRKPVVYLHHRDIPKHYEEGIFHYKTMGFGEICETNEELIDVLCNYMENDCVMPEVYRKHADDFFQYSDHKNCERIYPILRDYMLEQQK
ncbi:MAG: CDP-glycerol glycerophosphotransferase family protein, partial [Blautia sp.]|nr:CDP-glycerol glycerophosphotransferase family protein [Blautia sp.]